jgi:hypothetical protein
MVKKIWRSVSNIFDSCTRNSLRKMNAIGGDHFLKLDANKADAVIAVIYNSFKTVWQAFDAKYTEYKAAIADAQGTNQQLINLWKLASSKKYDAWDTAVKNVYEINSDEHKAFFPNGHEPFRNGTYEERFSNIKAFHKQLDDDGATAAAAQLVKDFMTEYETVFALNTAKHQLIKKLSAEAKKLRLDVAREMFANLGYLNWKYPDNPDLVESYFDTKLIIRSTPKAEGGENTELTIPVPGEKIVEGGFQFSDTTKIRAYNPGICDLYLYTKKDNNPGTIAELAYVLHPEDEADIIMSTLGEAGNRFFFIGNKSTDDGEIVVDIIE